MAKGRIAIPSSVGLAEMIGATRRAQSTYSGPYQLPVVLLHDSQSV